MAGSATSDETDGFLGAFHDTKFIEVLDENVVYHQLRDQRNIAKSNGVVITFHTISKLANGQRIVEGTQPTAQFMTGGTKTATIIQFGDITSYTDVMAKGSVANMREMALERLGKAAAKTIDNYIQDRLFSEVTEDYASRLAYHEGPQGTANYNTSMTTWYNGVHGGMSAYFLSTDLTTISSASFSAYFSADADNADLVDHEAAGGNLGKMTLKKIRHIAFELEENDVPGLDGEEYVMVTRPTVVKSIKEDPEWVEWNRYNNAEKMFKREIGSVEGVRIIKTTNQMKYNYALGTGLTAYLSTILGGSPFAITEFDGEEGVKTSVVPFENKDSSNVLGQTEYVGYMWTGACKVLDSEVGRGLITING